MPYKELSILLSCHSLEDFPTYHEGDDAASLLASWTGLWHPFLIHEARGILKWHRVDDPPEELLDKLIVVPTASAENLQTGYLQRAEDAGARVISRQTCRDEIIRQGLAGYDVPEIPESLVKDFLALGYFYLQIELLTRQMRYASNLDEIHFENTVCDAARFAVEGDQQQAEEKIQSAFDLLSTERDHYYSVDAFLIDINMVADSTLGEMLRKELDSTPATNLLMAPPLYEELVATHPQSAEAIKQRLADETLSILCCEQNAIPNALLPAESVRSQLLAGTDSYRKAFGDSPKVYGRRDFGLTANHPQWLKQLGFEAALHVLLGEGSYPESSQAKTRWEGVDNTQLDCIARVPLNANRHETFLSLSNKLGETMDMDHVATLCLAHWPGQILPWYEDIRRASRYTNALGKFVTLEEYFRDTDLPGMNEKFEGDQYKSPYLKQAMIKSAPNLISRSVRYWRLNNRLELLQGSNLMMGLLGGEQNNRVDQIRQELCQFSQVLAADDSEQQLDAIEQNVSTLQAELVSVLAAAVPRDGTPEQGTIVFNPYGATRRLQLSGVELEQIPVIDKPVYAAASAGDTKQVVVDTPSMGFTWLSAGKKREKSGPVIADKNVLKNDFFEVLINETTGGIQSINSYDAPRLNRGSFQLSYRRPVRKKSGRPAEPEDLANYSVMAADSVEVTAATMIYGEITVQGRIMSRQGEILSRYTQVVSLHRGSRVLNLDIELDISELPKNNPWNSYYCLRYAWDNEAASVTRAVNDVRQRASGSRLEAPQYLEVEFEKRTALLTGGLPFHRRVGRRFLDSILVVHGESCRKFQIGIGLDLPQPIHYARQFGMEPLMLNQTAAAPAGQATSSLLHVDARNVLITNWEPLVEANQLVGYKARVMESAGRPVRARLTSCRPVQAAAQFKLGGERIAECNLDEGRVILELTANEWIELEARFEIAAPEVKESR